MDVAPEGTTGLLVASADLFRPQTRSGGSRTRPLRNGFPCLMHVPNKSFNGARAGQGADGAAAATTSPTGMGFSAASRQTFNDCLSSIGLPGEESATFIPLIIEPYEPALSTAALTSPSGAAATTTTVTCGSTTELPASPLAPPTAPTQPSNSPPFPTLASKSTMVAIASTVPTITITPRPPPGSAVQRGNSCRRILVRQASNASTVAGGGATAAATTQAMGTLGLPTAPRTPIPTGTTDDPIFIPPSPVISSSVEVPVVLAEPPVVLPGGGGNGGGNGIVGDSSKATSSFLDPSKPAIRRLLPPLLRASQALQDCAAADAFFSLTADDGGVVTGCSLAQLPSRCNGGFNVCGNNIVSPAGGPSSLCGGILEIWSELQEVPAAAEAVPLSPPPPPPPLTVEMYDMLSPRGRRSLPPMDPLHTSAFSGVSASDAAELESAPLELGTPSDLGSARSPPRPFDSTRPSSSSTRRSMQQKFPWDAEGSPGREPRPQGLTASEAGEAASAGSASGDSDVPSMQMRRGPPVQRTPSFHGGSANGSGGGGATASAQAQHDLPRSRAWSAAASEVPLMALSNGSFGANGGSLHFGNSGANGGGGGGGGGGCSTNAGAGIPTPKDKCRINRANSLGLATPRVVVMAAAAPTAPLLPVIDRNSADRRQTSTTCS